MIEVIDNFLPHQDFQNIEKYFIDILQWKYQPCKVYDGPNENNIDNYQFEHSFYFQQSWDGIFRCEISPDFESVVPLLNKIDFLALHKVKANLEPLKSKQFFSDFHYDWAESVEDPIPSNKMTTAIYYVNTCDGYTEFEDGTKTQCVANRLVKFPSNLKHRGVSQTDNRLKSVINLNFFTP
tara:strand:+ start:1235 stop:1777 length:543 start_codon:yes stop_codon:yes gene_type:complete